MTVRQPHRERGVALLTVLLLVAIMAVIAGSVLEKLKLSTRLAINAAAIDQARHYALAAEELAKLRIGDLRSLDAARTTLAGDWNGRTTQLPIPGGLAAATLTDGGNCFNLNSVVAGEASGPATVNPAGVQQFAALMGLLDIPAGDAARIAASLADWIDSDSVPLPGGAEDDHYARLDPAYRTANSTLADISELRAIAGVTPDIYARLRPWICALPVRDLSPLNINTLSPDQAILLAMLAPQALGVENARRMLVQRPAGGYESVREFWTQPGLAGLGLPSQVTEQVKVQTNWFALDIEVELADSALRETALIDATLAPAQVVRRQWGDPS